jgi:hypothetical protein
MCKILHDYRDVPDVQTNVMCFTKVCTMCTTVPYLQGCARCAERCLIYRVVLDVQNGALFTGLC